MRNSFRNLSYPELKAKRDELKKKFMELRFQRVIGHVDNPLQKRTMRRQIARLNTIIHEHDTATRRAAILESLKNAQNLPVGAAEAEAK